MADSGTTEANAVEAKPEQPNTEEPAAVPPAEMRAVVLTGFGGLKSVKVMKKPEPVAEEGEVLIRVKACGLNFLDLMVRQGTIDNLPKTPFVMGFECAGEVEVLGEGVQDFKVGDPVVAMTEFKSWAELVAVSTKYVYKLPPGMSFQDASAITMNFVVAYALLFDIGGLHDGQSVLLHSAGGGVGQAIAQLCKMKSDITLIGTASKHKHEDIKDSFSHLIDHGSDYVQEVKKNSPEGVDLVLDCLCGEDANKGYNLLKPLGRYILYGTSSIVSGETKSFFSFAKSWWQVDKVSPIKLFDDNRTISGFHLRHLLFQQNGQDYVRQLVNKVFDLWREGKIKPVIDSIWAFEDIPDAMQKLHDRKNIGKVTLDPKKEPKPKPQAKNSKDKEGKPAVQSGESTDTEKDAKEGEQSPPPTN